MSLAKQLKAVERLRCDLQKITKVTEQAIATMKEAFPIGRTFEYKQGRHYVEATVVSHGFGLSLKVKGVKSGKEYWINNIYRCV